MLCVKYDILKVKNKMKENIFNKRTCCSSCVFFLLTCKRQKITCAVTHFFSLLSDLLSCKNYDSHFYGVNFTLLLENSKFYLKLYFNFGNNS